VLFVVDSLMRSKRKKTSLATSKQHTQRRRNTKTVMYTQHRPPQGRFRLCALSHP